MNDGKSFEPLCQVFIEKIATPEEQSQFVALLDASEESRGGYIEQMRIHALLVWQHGRVPAGLAVIRVASKIVPFFRRSWLAAAAAVLLTATLALWWPAKQGETGVSFEVLSSSEGLYPQGEVVTQRTIEMEQGSLSLRLTSGALVEVTGPAKVELVSPMCLRVLRGTVEADISKGAKGFVVETAQAKVVDLGTRFSVSAEARAGTNVIVFEGEVEVYDPSGKITENRPKITLVEGEAVRVQPSRQPDRLRMVSVRSKALSPRGRTGADIISDIEDDVTDGEFRGYYALLRGGFDEGARAYTTGHTRRWRAMPGSSFPQELVGADAICTFGVDRKDANLQLTLHVSSPCDLYVMADARTAAPEWLRKDFTDTGYRIRSGPWIPRGTPKADQPRFYTDETAYVPYTVWARRIPTPGPVILGSPQSSDEWESLAMYGISVKAF